MITSEVVTDGILAPVPAASQVTLKPTGNTNDFGTYFVNQILPHVKSFAYTWFHLQAAKRKHFKNEDRRMNPVDEEKLKNKLESEDPSVKIKWAVRLLMKLRKDIQGIYQKELVNVIRKQQPAAEPEPADRIKNESQCVLSNPDMKGKMRRIDCLRQSDKVWRIDLVMVVLFKGIPLESSDGERLDKLAECNFPQLCVNPNHALLNVRDLEVYLANYINHQMNDVAHHKNIASPSVFTSQEFLQNADITILAGASESDLKNSLNMTSGLTNSHYSDDNEDTETPAAKTTSVNSHVIKSIPLKEELLNGSENNIKLTELGKVCLIENKRPADLIDGNNKMASLPKKKKLKKTLKEQTTNINERDLSVRSPNGLVKCENVADFDLNFNENNPSKQIISIVEAIQPDEEIKALLKNDKTLTNEVPVKLPVAHQQFNSRKITTDELKDLIQKEKQNTADLFMQLLKTEQPLQTTPSQITNNNNPQQPTPNYMHQNSNSSDLSIAELSNIHNNMNNQAFFQHQLQRIKSNTPSCVDQLLISPLFNQFLPSCGSASSNSSNSSSSCSSTNANPNNQNQNNGLSFSQFAAAAAQVVNSNKNNNSNTVNSNRKTPQSFLMSNNGAGEEILGTNSNLGSKITHGSRSSFKRTKHANKAIVKNSKPNNESNDPVNKTNNSTTVKPNHNISTSCINALRFDSNSNNSFDELVTINGTSDFPSSSTKTTFSTNNTNHKPTTNRTKTPTRPKDNNLDHPDSDIIRPINGNVNGGASPPPPPSIGTLPIITADASAPSPTKLPQFHPYTPSSGHVMHRPIPILQKADAALSSLINNLTSSPSLSHMRASPSSSSSSSPQNNLTSSKSAKNNSQTTNSTTVNGKTSKTPSLDQMNELIKINSQQQQLISSLRSSMGNNSPLMFNMGFNNGTTTNTGSYNNFNSGLTNSNIFSNYPNISPANGMMSGNTNSGSPTSNLFPSITSLFQSPIGTPRVTPTPQHLAAYFFNEDQFHSLIFNPNSSLSNSNDLSNMITNFTNSEFSNNLSPLPLFNNLISTSMGNSMNGQNNNGSNSNQDAGKMINGHSEQGNNSETSALNTPKNNLLSANN